LNGEFIKLSQLYHNYAINLSHFASQAVMEAGKGRRVASRVTAQVNEVLDVPDEKLPVLTRLCFEMQIVPLAARPHLAVCPSIASFRPPLWSDDIDRPSKDR
jgi:hypothetical protein